MWWLLYMVDPQNGWFGKSDHFLWMTGGVPPRWSFLSVQCAGTLPGFSPFSWVFPTISHILCPLCINMYTVYIHIYIYIYVYVYKSP